MTKIQQKKKSEKKFKNIKEKELNLMDRIKLRKDNINKNNVNLITTNTQDSKTKPYNVTKHKSWSDIKGILKSIKIKLNPEKAMLINMELDNGEHTQFTTFINKNHFVRNKKLYIIDDELKYYNISANMWCLDYHESLSIPIKRDLELTKLKREMIDKGITDVDKAINPSNLKQFIDDAVIEKVMKGQKMDDFFHFIKIMVIIIAIMSFLTLALFIKESGMLEQMNIPFL
ncbi:MAG: hypothetical protein ACQERX_02120 [Bacillota bacterium]